MCTERVANLLAIYLPWGTAWMFYNGGSTTALLGWGGIIFTSIIAFLAPLLMGLHAATTYTCDGSISVYGRLVLSRRQKVLVLYGLLIFSSAAIVLAIIGELY